MHQRLNKLLIQGKVEDIKSHESEKTISSSARLQYVREVRELIEEKKRKIRVMHIEGASGIDIVKEYTKLVDDLIVKIYQVVVDNPPQHFIKGGQGGLAVVALGGYGRGELNPFSDIDILFLFNRKLESYIDFAIHNIISILWDIGFNVGHSTRSINDCLSVAKGDVTARTAMMEGRYLTGDKEIFDNFFNSFKRDFMKRGVEDFIKLKLEETRQRHSVYGDTVCVSEPNLKDGPGGLRDIHTALWSSMVKFGVNSFEGLEKRGIIDNLERGNISKAVDFIFRVRNDMHFLSEKKNDILSHEIQEVVSRNLGYSDKNGVRGVIWFMKDYYTNASCIYHFSDSLVERCLEYKSGILARVAYLKTKKLGEGFVSIKDKIYIENLNLDIFKKDPLLLLKVFLYCQEFNLTVSSSIRRVINSSLPLIDSDFINSSEANEIFRKIIKGRGLSKILRIMHDCGVLRKFIMEFEHISYLSNYDLYHKFTVDEHILRSLEYLEKLSETGEEDAELRNIYKGIADKTILKVALFMHDIGKSDVSGHIKRGVEIVPAVLKRWGMEDIRDMVLLLVENHLIISHIAQRRDMHDEKTIAELCRKVKNVENLRMLYLLTYADLKAVGLDVWTNWKSALLWELILRAYEYFSRSEEEKASDSSSLIDKKRRDVYALIDNKLDGKVINSYFSSMPEKYILSTSSEKIVKHIGLAWELDGKKLVIKYFHNTEVGYTELMVCTTGKAGVFSKIAGTLTSKNMNILGAQIYTRLDGIAIDTLQVSTVDGNPVLDEGMLKRFEQDLLQVLEDKRTVEELLSVRQKLHIPHERRGFKISTMIEIDNSLSDTHTIIEVITMDRLGVLYDITHTLFNLGLNIYIAKISTEGRTAIDVFYVTEINGGKIMDGNKAEGIKNSLLRALV